MGYFVSQSLSVILLLMLCNRRQETAAPSPNQARRSPATMFSPSRCSMGRLMGIKMVVFLDMIVLVMVMVMMMVIMMVMRARRFPATMLSLFRCSMRNLMIIRMFKMMLNKNSDGDGVHGHDGRMSQHFALQ